MAVVKTIGKTFGINNKLKENVREGLSDSFNSMYIRSTHREPRLMTSFMNLLS